MHPGRFDPHIRPINVRKDLRFIADLIEQSFFEQMDAEGRDYLRHIRQIAAGFSPFMVDGGTPETSPFPFQGYLWEEEGKIIGNITLILIKRKSVTTYFIANVAVEPSQRGKGIARKLTARAIAHVQEHGGKQICLQVRSDNPTAIRIYQETGFEETSRRTSWGFSKQVPPVEKSAARYEISRRKKEDWGEQQLLLQRVYPPDVAWNLPINPNRLRPGFTTWLENFMSNITVRTWVIRQNGRLLGSASVESGAASQDYVWLASSPSNEDAVILSLMPYIFHKAPKPQQVVVNYPAGEGVDSFYKCAMKEIHTLIWMKKDLQKELSPLP